MIIFQLRPSPAAPAAPKTITNPPHLKAKDDQLFLRLRAQVLNHCIHCRLIPYTQQQNDLLILIFHITNLWDVKRINSVNGE